MPTDFKSHILRRDEKGFFGIPFKRLLLSGMIGSVILALTQGTLGQGPGMVLAIVGVIAALTLTASRGGLPLWQRLWFGLQARLASTSRESALYTLVKALASLGVKIEPVTLDASELFGAEQKQTAITRPTDWRLYTDALSQQGLTLTALEAAPKEQ